MNYISAEQFLKLPEEIQKVFMDWYKLNEGDRVCDTENKEEVIILYKEIDMFGLEHFWHYDFISERLSLIGLGYEDGYFVVPCLRIDQLWEFIETVTQTAVTVSWIDYEYRVHGASSLGYDEDKIQAFWKAAVKVAEMKVRGNDEDN